jgi:hypothetical protein
MADQPEARVFNAKTRFQTLARRPGGVPRGQAVENAQNQVEEAKLGFEEWLEGELTELSGWIERAKTGEPVEEWIEAADFHAHQLRDVGTTVGFELLTFIAGTLCTIFDGIKAGADVNMESIVCHIDALLLIRQRKYRNLRPDQVPELSRGLFRVADIVSIVPKMDENGQS